MVDLPTPEVLSLLAKVGRGDALAATTIFKHYNAPLFAFVRFLVPHDQDAEDITQEVFKEALTKVGGFSGQSKYSTWLCAVAKNKTVDWWRKNGRPAQAANDDDEEILDGLVDPNWDFVAALIMAQDRDTLQYCLDKLSPTHQEAVYWVYYEDFSVEEAGTRMECPTGTVQSRLFHARKQLKRCLQNWLKGGRDA